MSKYPRVDVEGSGYTACVRYTSMDEWPTLRLPGIHDTYEAAASRAGRFRDALRQIGGDGCFGAHRICRRAAGWVPAQRR